ncbi:MAG TPA: ABC transporter substrate-binding protein [Gemmatimonadaceae bacterium]|nr:ABC transporter substrate-binding protein [Gemmatimonadaceae bacterium]
MRTPILLSWSGGKDSALALQALRADPVHDVVALLTSVTRGYDRVSIHGVRRALLDAQVAAVGLPLITIELEPDAANDAYEAAFHAALRQVRREHPRVAHIAFGDLFLADVRAYRERMLAGSGFDPVFPIWGRDTSALARQFVDDGFAARLVCVDTTRLDSSFAGRRFDDALLAELPAGVDPCGERGEFHTFVSAGPVLSRPVPYVPGDTVLRDGRFMYCDLLPGLAMPRIVSFLPAGTEIVYALGAGHGLVGRSHECDYPNEAAALPIVSRPALRLEGMSQGAIDKAVAERLGSGGSLYEVDERLLRDLAADVVLTQDLCQVCAPSGTELARAVRDLPTQPEVVWLSPRTIPDIEQNVLAVGEAIGRRGAAESLVMSIRARIARVQGALAGAERRRIVFLEWTEPVFCAGHWVPGMVALAGGEDPLGRSGAESQRVTWDAVAAAAPELVVVAPCGYGLTRAAELARGVPPIGDARVIAVDASGYFARPGPRVAEGIELLAHLFHPNRFGWPHAHRPWAEIDRA